MICRRQLSSAFMERSMSGHANATAPGRSGFDIVDVMGTEGDISMAHQVRRLAVITIMGGLCLAAPMLAAGRAAAEPSAADIQWAQSILKDKGLFSGRANGDNNPQTRAA